MLSDWPMVGAHVSKFNQGIGRLPSRIGLDPSEIGLFAGGGLMTIGTFLPWEEAAGSGSWNGMAMGAEGGFSATGIWIMLAGLAAIVIGLERMTRPRLPRWLSLAPILLGLLGLVNLQYGLFTWNFISSDPVPNPTTGSGLWAVLVGSGVLVLSGVVTLVKRGKHVAPSESETTPAECSPRLPSRIGLDPSELGLFIGGAAMAIGTFLPWIRITQIGTLESSQNGLQLGWQGAFSATGAWVLAAGLIAIVIGIERLTRARMWRWWPFAPILLGAVGLAGLSYSMLTWTEPSDMVFIPPDVHTTGYGVYVVLVGVSILLVSGAASLWHAAHGARPNKQVSAEDKPDLR